MASGTDRGWTWREFAFAWLVENTNLYRSELNVLFAGFLATVDEPAGYVVRQISIISAVKPQGARAVSGELRTSASLRWKCI